MGLFSKKIKVRADAFVRDQVEKTERYKVELDKLFSNALDRPVDQVEVYTVASFKFLSAMCLSKVPDSVRTYYSRSIVTEIERHYGFDAAEQCQIRTLKYLAALDADLASNNADRIPTLNRAIHDALTAGTGKESTKLMTVILLVFWGNVFTDIKFYRDLDIK